MAKKRTKKKAGKASRARVPAKAKATVESGLTLSKHLKGFRLLTIKPDRMMEIIRTNLGAGGVGQFDLQRIKVPSGGGVFWMLEDLRGEPRAEKSLDVIVLEFRDVRAYWEKAYGDGTKTPPQCSSNDAITGYGDPGGDCTKCPLAAFGSKDGGKGRGQACKSARLLLVATSGKLIPSIVSLPPMSIGPCKSFFLALASEELEVFRVLLTLTLEAAVNAGNQDYSRAKIALKEVLDAPVQEQVAEIREAILKSFMQKAPEAGDFS